MVLNSWASEVACLILRGYTHCSLEVYSIRQIPNIDCITSPNISSTQSMSLPFVCAVAVIHVCPPLTFISHPSFTQTPLPIAKDNLILHGGVRLHFKLYLTCCWLSRAIMASPVRMSVMIEDTLFLARLGRDLARLHWSRVYCCLCREFISEKAA